MRYVPLNPSDFHSCLVGTHIASGAGIFQGNSVFTHGLYDAKLGGVEGGSGVPFVAGSDGIATVQKVGPGVRNLSEGDWVIPAKAGLGTWRSLAVWKEKDTIKLPVDIMPLEHGAEPLSPSMPF